MHQYPEAQVAADTWRGRSIVLVRRYDAEVSRSVIGRFLLPEGVVELPQTREQSSNVERTEEPACVASAGILIASFPWILVTQITFT